VIVKALIALILLLAGGLLVVLIGIPDLAMWAWRKTGAATRRTRREAGPGEGENP
jgi:hypothetical protein